MNNNFQAEKENSFSFNSYNELIDIILKSKKNLENNNEIIEDFSTSNTNENLQVNQKPNLNPNLFASARELFKIEIFKFRDLVNDYCNKLCNNYPEPINPTIYLSNLLIQILDLNCEQDNQETTESKLQKYCCQLYQHCELKKNLNVSNNYETIDPTFDLSNLIIKIMDLNCEQDNQETTESKLQKILLLVISRLSIEKKIQ